MSCLLRFTKLAWTARMYTSWEYRRISIYLMEKREVYHLYHLKTFSLPLAFNSYRNLRVALRWAWNLRGLVNDLVRKLNYVSEIDDEAPPKVFFTYVPTPDTPVDIRKIFSVRSQ